MPTVPLPDARVRWGTAVLVTAAALGATLSPAGAAPALAPDWVLHAAGFGFLAVVYAFALDGRPPRTVLAGAFCLTVALGAGVELVQPAFGRTASFADFAADVAGTALALALYRTGHRWVRWT